MILWSSPWRPRAAAAITRSASRYFFFEEPHPEIAAHFDEALKLQEYQLNYYRPGMTMQQLRDG